MRTKPFSWQIVKCSCALLKLLKLVSHSNQEWKNKPNTTLQQIEMSKIFYRPKKLNCRHEHAQSSNWIGPNPKVSLLFYMFYLPTVLEDKSRTRSKLCFAFNFLILPQIYCHMLEIVNYKCSWKSQQGNNISAVEWRHIIVILKSAVSHHSHCILDLVRNRSCWLRHITLWACGNLSRCFFCRRVANHPNLKAW